MDTLRDKTLVMIVGPTAVGKSTIMHEITRLDGRFSYVESFTSRPERDGETSTYRHISEEEARRLHRHGMSVTYFEHPTTHIIYGTTADSYTNDYNLLDTLSGTVETYRTLPFRRTITISVTTDPDTWQERLSQRFPEPSDDRTKRLHEAEISIKWSLAQTSDHIWVNNGQEDPVVAASEIISSVLRDSVPYSGTPTEAPMLLKRVQSLLSYE